MGHAPVGSLLRRRRLRVRIKRALLVVAGLVAMGLLVMAAGPAPPAIERLPTLGVRDPAFVGTLEARGLKTRLQELVVLPVRDLL